MRLSSVLCLIVLSVTSLGAPPKLQSCSWRVAPWNIPGAPTPFELMVISCQFDQELYTMVNGSNTKISAIKGVEVTVTQTGSQTDPKAHVLLAGVGKLCCGSKCTNSSQIALLYTLPSTTAPLLSFVGAFVGAAIPSSPDDTKLNWVYVLNQNRAVADNLAGMKQCAMNNQLTLEYGSGTVAACKSSFPKSNCQVSGADGAFATRGQKVTLGMINVGSCRPLRVQKTKEDLLGVLRSELSKVANHRQLNNLQLLMAAFQTQQSFVACSSLVNRLVSFRKVSKNVGTSRACQYDYSTQRAQYRADPCCWGFTKKCCVPRPLTRQVTEIASLNVTMIKARCSDSSSALKTLRLIQQDTNQLAAEKSLVVNVNEEYLKLYTVHINKCRREVFYGLQSCSTDDDCWTGVCNIQSSSQGTCGQGENAYLPFLKCMVAQLSEDQGVVKNIKRIANATGTTPAQIAESAVPYLKKFEVDDCIGGGFTSWQARVRFEYKLDPNTGNYERTLRPVNRSLCLSERKCNFAPGLTSAQCAAINPSTHFCAQCYGSYCFEVSQFARCEVGGFGATQAQCAAAGGELIQYSRYGAPSCVDKTKTTRAACLPSAVCNPNNDWSCSSAFCYSNATTYRTCNGYISSRLGNGRGLCVVWRASSKASCEATPGQTWFGGARWIRGKYDTQAKCESPKCKFYGDYRLQELSNKDCRNAKVCDQTCARCLSGRPSVSNPMEQDYCIVIKNGTCPSNSDLNSTHCIVSGVNSTACAISGGQYATCSTYSWWQCWRRSTGGDPRQKMQCTWNYNAPCSNSECLAAGKGYCTDGSVGDSTTPNKTRCIFPFMNEPGTTFPGSNCNSSASPSQTLLPNGCGATAGSPENQDEARCVAQGGRFVRQAKTRAECLVEKGCNRYGYPIPMPTKNCQECNGRQVPLFSWIAPKLISGQVVQLKWMQRQYGPVNKIVKAIPNEIIQNLAEEALMQNLGHRFGQKLRRETLGKLLAYQGLSCACIPSGSSQAASNLCNTVKNQAYSVVRGTCSCNAGVCDDSCPYQCSNSTCSYNVTQYFGSGYASANLASRRILQNYAPYEIIKDANGQIVGQIVGNADQYSGNLGGSYRLCLTIDVASIPQSPAYTVYDFAPGTGANGAPGRPMMMTVTQSGNELCGDVSDNRAYWPIKRLAPGKTRAPTTANPNATPGPTVTATTKAGSGVERSAVWLASAMVLLRMLG